MPQQLTEILQTVEVTEAVQAGPLQVFGLRWRTGRPLTYTTLDEALAAETLDVTEVNEGGSVPTLKVVNKADPCVFLMAGEQLIGAKQNRILNASILVPGRSELPIPVSCVEAGRWRYHSPKFSSSGTSSHSYLRVKVSKHAHASYRLGGTPTSDQGAVWDEVSRKLTSMGSSSPSRALHQAYEDYEERLTNLLGQLRIPEGSCGAAFAFGGRIAGVDLFDQATTLVKLWPKLVRAYALDALEESESAAAPVTAGTVGEWLRSVAGAKEEPYKSPGLGYDVRLEGKDLVGAGLVVEEQPVHVELFTQPEPVAD
jgi:hypothetical protein